MMTVTPYKQTSPAVDRLPSSWVTHATAGLTGLALTATLVVGTSVPVTTAHLPPTMTIQMAGYADLAWRRITVTRVTDLAPASTLARLRELSGLTIDQIGRLMGVSRRAVHKWLSGGAMSAINEERLQHLLEVVLGLGEDTPEARRAALLSAANGPSLMYRLVQELPESARLQVPAYGVRDRIAL